MQQLDEVLELMVDCRCDVLNVMSGDVARDYTRRHLDELRVDGMGRSVYRCPETGIGWTEQRTSSGYGDDVRVLRRTDRT